MTADVTRVRYQPHAESYRLDVEVLDAAELRRRVASDRQRGFERVEFLCVLFVRSGVYTHTVDFEQFRCTAGSCLVIRPGQVHRFGPASNWEGWMLIIGAHLVPDEVDMLAPSIRTSGAARQAIVELFERMALDASSSLGVAQLNELLALQARVLVRRLVAGHADPDAAALVDPGVISRFREYRAAVDEHFRRWHLVAPYARHLGCSTKSLNRACRAISDVTAKGLIVERIVLEAKRHLAHGSEPVSAISDDLGFDEPTNFVKFFRRETALTPARFRETVARP